MNLHVFTKTNALKRRRRGPIVAIAAALFVCATILGAAVKAGAFSSPGPGMPGGGEPPIRQAHAAQSGVRPWIEGVDPLIETRLFYATYGALRTHNVLKVYAFSAGGYESAGVRISGRVPHEQGDLTLAELSSEAVTLIRATFDGFPDVQELDVWATIPVAQIDQTSTESTVFSVSADRATYERIARRTDLSDEGFLAEFGRVWAAPQVPR
jgi:hypothetical protein